VDTAAAGGAAQLEEKCRLGRVASPSAGRGLRRLPPRLPAPKRRSCPPLPTASHPGVLEAKWCRNRFTPFLCVDPRHAATPLARDAEEYVEVVRLTLTQLRAAMRGGEMLTPSVQTCVMALAELERRRLLPPGTGWHSTLLNDPHFQ
jgi:hypothetical protein